GDDRRAVLEIRRWLTDDRPQPLDGLLGYLVLHVQGVQPASVDAPLVGGRCRCPRPILAGTRGACSVRGAAGPASSPCSWAGPLPGPPATGGAGNDHAARCGRRGTR